MSVSKTLPGQGPPESTSDISARPALALVHESRNHLRWLGEALQRASARPADGAACLGSAAFYAMRDPETRHHFDDHMLSLCSVGLAGMEAIISDVPELLNLAHFADPPNGMGPPGFAQFLCTLAFGFWPSQSGKGLAIREWSSAAFRKAYRSTYLTLVTYFELLIGRCRECNVSCIPPGSRMSTAFVASLCLEEVDLRHLQEYRVFSYAGFLGVLGREADSVVHRYREANASSASNGNDGDNGDNGLRASTVACLTRFVNEGILLHREVHASDERYLSKTSGATPAAEMLMHMREATDELLHNGLLGPFPSASCDGGAISAAAAMSTLSSFASIVVGILQAMHMHANPQLGTQSPPLTQPASRAATIGATLAALVSRNALEIVPLCKGHGQSDKHGERGQPLRMPLRCTPFANLATRGIFKLQSAGEAETSAETGTIDMEMDMAYALQRLRVADGLTTKAVLGNVASSEQNPDLERAVAARVSRWLLNTAARAASRSPEGEGENQDAERLSQVREVILSLALEASKRSRIAILILTYRGEQWPADVPAPTCPFPILALARNSAVLVPQQGPIDVVGLCMGRVTQTPTLLNAHAELEPSKDGDACRGRELVKGLVTALLWLARSWTSADSTPGQPGRFRAAKPRKAQNAPSDERTIKTSSSSSTGAPADAVLTSVRHADAIPLVEVQKTALWLASSTLTGWHGEYVDRALPEFCVVAENLRESLGELPIVKDAVGGDVVQPRRRLWSQVTKALQVAYADGCLYGYAVAVAWVLTGKGVCYLARKVSTRSIQTWSASCQDAVAILRELAASALAFERALHAHNCSAAASKASSLPLNTGPPRSEESRLLQQHAADIVLEEPLDYESAFEIETLRGFTPPPQLCSLRILGRGDHAEQGFAVAVLGNELITQRAAAIARRNQVNPAKSRCGWVDD